MIKLGSTVTDSVTKIEGKLMHISYDMEENIMVNFRPNTLKPDTGEASETFWITPTRISGFNPYLLIQTMPTAILGTKVTEPSNGFTGIAVEMVLHLNGCVHIVVQPPGIDKKTGTRFKTENFDVRELVGDKVPKFTDSELEADKKSKPSPSAFKPYRPGR